MKKLSRLCILLLCMLISGVALAIPAKSGLMSITQKDKRVLNFYLYGDEWMSYAKTTDGYTLLPKQDGSYYYAVLDKNGDMVASNVLAANPSERTQEENAFLSSLNKGIFFSESQKAAGNNNIFNSQLINSTYPSEGDNPLLVILVEFPDRPFTYTLQQFHAMVCDSGYSDNGGTGSVRDYYRDNSFGKLRLAPTVVGPYTLSHNMAYYGGNDPAISSFHDCRPKEMISEACHLADSIDNIDFTQFDVDNDGKIDAVHVIYAGKPESSSGETDAIWPHRWSIWDYDNIQNFFDGKRLQDYSCSGEKRSNGTMDGIGTICHEFGHVLGLPDYYDTDYEGTGGNATALSSWSTMASGSYNNNGNTPPIFNANERTILGWSKLDTLSTQGTYTLYPLIDSNAAYILTTKDADDYYVIENRSQTSWDTYLPGNGMLIYHVKAANDCINCNPEYQKMDIVEADNIENSASLSSDVFTHPTVNHYFTSYSTPACFVWSDMSKVDKPITNIQIDSLGIVSFRYLIPDTNAIIKTLGHRQNDAVSYTLSGLSIYDGIDQNPSKGFLVNTANNFTNATFYPADNTVADTFYYSLQNISYGQTYYYKAAAILANGDTLMAETKNFQTASGQPNFITKPISKIGLDTLDVTVVKVSNGVYPITEYGLVYDTISSIDTNSNRIRFYGDLDTMNVTINNLEQNTKYFIKAYIITNLGIKYGASVSATTKFIPIENNLVEEVAGVKCYQEDWGTISASEPTGGVGDFAYLWQKKTSRNGSWSSAEGINNEKDYYAGTPEGSIWLRRLVFSHNIKDTSNTVSLSVRKSIAGTISGKDTLYIGMSDTLILKNYTGNILSWSVYDQDPETFSPIYELMEDTNSITVSANNGNDLTVFVYVQDSVCPVDTAMKVIVGENNVSLVEINNSLNAFLTSPNPASDFINITNKTKETYSFTIYNLQGKAMFSEENISSPIHKVNTSKLENGTYLIHFTTISKKEQTIKVLISR